MVELPGYRLLEELGRGGMARVYLALHEGLDRHVAIKLMYPNLSTDPAFSERFLREARIVARLNHPNIITIFDVNVHNRYHYIAMEYLPGETLGDKIKTGITATKALSLLKRLALGLKFAHDKGFIHRDIKPENILFREDGTPVITDFGVARSERSETKMTQVGTIIGTPQYMSPEQAQGFEIKSNADLYSLGIVFYEMLMGIVPYRADSFVGIMYKHVNDPVPVLPEKLKIYQPLLDKLLAKNAQDRYQSAKDLIKDIERIEIRVPAEFATIIKPSSDPIKIQADDRTRIKPLTPQAIKKRSKAKFVLFASVSLLGLLGIVAVLLYSRHETVVSSQQRAIAQAKKLQQQKLIAEKRQLQQKLTQQAELAQLRKEKQQLAQKQAALAREQAKAAQEKAKKAQQAEERKRIATIRQKQAQLRKERALLFRKKQIANLTNAAQSSIQQNKLMAAYHDYQNILQMDNTNRTAREGINVIAKKYIELALARAKADDFKMANAYLNSAEQISPDLPDINNTQQSIFSLKQKFLSERDSQANKSAEKHPSTESATNKTPATPKKNNTQQIFGGF